MGGACVCVWGTLGELVIMRGCVCVRGARARAVSLWGGVGWGVGGCVRGARGVSMGVRGAAAVLAGAELLC